jgi:nucleoside-diphosphate-sugar epimerase
MTTFLITGGAGFIGSHLAEALLDRGQQVLVLDDLSSGSVNNIAHLRSNSRFRFVPDSISSLNVLAEGVDLADVIFHMAATVGVFNIIESPVKTIVNNIGGTEMVLKAAAKKRKKVIITSTSEVYGKSNDVPFREDGDLVLGPSSKSRWSYASSKLVDEFLALAYWHEFKVPTVVARLFNTIGPRQTGHYGMVVPRFMSQALRGENLTVYGNGQQSRCFTYVSDIVEGLMLLAANEKVVGGVFNLGNIEEVSIAELARKILMVTSSKVGIEYIPYEKAYEEGFEDMERRVPDLTKVKSFTGYSPRINLDQSLCLIRDWFVNERIAENTEPPNLSLSSRLEKE